MRIISGSAKGREILMPASVTRPTTDKTRGAVFSILNSLILEANCVDLFCGSGALGLEALSRGANHCFFIDHDKRSIDVVKKNLNNLNLETKASTRVKNALECSTVEDESLDIIFADPPYVKQVSDTDFVQKVIDSSWVDKLKPEAYLIAEAPVGRAHICPNSIELVMKKKYGKCGLFIYKKL